MKKIIDWIIYSSEDPAVISMTVKGILTAAIPTVIFLAKIFNVDVGGEDLTAFVDAAVIFIGAVAAAISAYMTVVGFFRKIFTTLTGNNAVLNDYKAQGK